MTSILPTAEKQRHSPIHISCYTTILLCPQILLLFSFFSYILPFVSLQESIYGKKQGRWITRAYRLEGDILANLSNGAQKVSSHGHNDDVHPV
jgi:hypothetical protein